MASQPRTRLGTDERRAQLLEVGVALFSSRSYDEISIDDIAAAAGVSKGLLYHYFPTKRDFYVAGLREAAAQIVALTEPDAALPPPARLRQSLGAYVDYVESHAVGYRSLMRGGIGSDAEVRAILDEIRAAIERRVLDGMDVETPPEALRLALRGWMAFVEEASLDWLDRRAPAREALLDLFIAVLGAAIDAAGRAGSA
jgi:AcrR family transcriptional regulator